MRHGIRGGGGVGGVGCWGLGRGGPGVGGWIDTPAERAPLRASACENFRGMSSAARKTFEFVIAREMYVYLLDRASQTSYRADRGGIVPVLPTPPDEATR